MAVTEEFHRLKGIHYLDHAGATLYSERQMQNIMQDFCGSVYGNPHSLNTICKYTNDIVDQIRYRVLRHFNTDLDEYDVIFTSGATEAVKLVAESFNFGTGKKGAFVYAQENHTSVIGMREAVADRCSTVLHLSSKALEEIFSEENHQAHIDPKSCMDGENSLFAISGQCNFSGAKTPLHWVQMAKCGILNNDVGVQSKWACLLDAATLAATSPLDLSLCQPDFVTLSFYKMFGYPTGLGALLVKKSSTHFLSDKKYFGGGTVLMALSGVRKHIARPILHERFEDGTISYLSIIAVGHGLDTLSRLMGSMSNVRRHTFSLARRAHHSLKNLCHYNDTPVAILYCDNDFEDPDTQGAIVNFNLLRPDGKHVGYNKVLNMANSHKIQLRTGCFCNPGACQRHLGLSEKDLQSHFEAGHVCGDKNDLINGVPTGTVRISFGYMSTEDDVTAFLNMVYQCFVENEAPSKDDNFKEVWHDASDNMGNLQCEQGSSFIFRPVELSQVVLYPIKSCGGFKPSSAWTIGSRGLLYDRTWMIVSASGTALTQSLEPRLALVKPYIDLINKILCLRFSEQSEIVSVPLDETNDKEKSASLCQSKVCGDRIKGIDCGDKVASWLSANLGRHGIRLVRQLNEDERAGKDVKKSIALSNKAQFLMISEESVSWLGDQIDSKECDKTGLLNRFRANLVVKGLKSPFEEMDWDEIRIGTQKFTVDGPCTRCGVVCVDQATGKRTNEPLKTLSKINQHNVHFGIYLSHQCDGDDDGIGLISSGNTVTVLKSKCKTNGTMC